MNNNNDNDQNLFQNWNKNKLGLWLWQSSKQCVSPFFIKSSYLLLHLIQMKGKITIFFVLQEKTKMFKKPG